MRKTVQILSISIVLISILSSCSVEKRRYMSGYNIEWKNSKPEIKRNEFVEFNKRGEADKIAEVKLETAVRKTDDATLTASADNSEIIKYNRNKKSNLHHVDLSEECDVIILKNGEEIKAKVSEISQGEIKYKKCDDLNGQTYTLKKSEVFMIKYPNGTKDIITADTHAEPQNKPVEKEDTGVFGILSMASIILSIILLSTAGGMAVLLLIPAAIVFGAIGAGPKRKLRGLAMAGMILGILYVLLILIAVAAFSNSSLI